MALPGEVGVRSQPPHAPLDLFGLNLTQFSRSSSMICIAGASVDGDSMLIQFTLYC